MKKTTLILIGVIVLLIMVGFFGKNYYDSKLQTANNKNRTLLISKDSLQKVAEGHYTKLVADTLKQRELNKIIDSLSIKLDAKPKVVTVIEYTPQPKDTETEVTEVTKDSVSIKDYYPNKIDPFIKYSSKISLKTEVGRGRFDFNPFNLSLIVSQKEDGTYRLDTKVPEWLEVNDIQVQSTPLTPTKPDNFGWILGASYGKDYSDFSNYLRLNGGFRFKKFYVIGGASTNKNIDIGINLEF